MKPSTAKAIFLVGTLSSAILFLALTVDTHRQVGALTHADRLSDQVVAGKKVFEKYNCNDCHTMLGFGGYYAPDLTRVYGRRGEDYIRAVVSSPETVLARSFRKMPQQHLSTAEIDNLIAFFRWTNDIDTHDWPPQDSRKRPSEVGRLVGAATVSRGAALFKAHNCFSCHKLGGVGGAVGPALDDVGERFKDTQAIKAFIADPKSVNPKSVMPAYRNLPDGDLKALAEFLAKQRGDR